MPAAETSRILAPHNFPTLRAPMAQGEAVGSNVDFATVCNTPNAGLLWQRYLPLHHRKAETHEGISALGPSVQQSYEDAYTAANNGDNRPMSDLKGGVSRWNAHGYIDWYSERVAESMNGEAEILRLLQARRARTLTSAKALSITTKYRLVIGAGNPSIVENSGFAFEHTYGFPVLPASSLKGICRYYLESGQIEENETLLEEHNQLIEQLRSEINRLRFSDAELSAASMNSVLFGLEAAPEAMGLLTFYDGWPLFPSEGELPTLFEPDVITPHHTEYYRDHGAKAPDDTDNTNVIHFLVIRKDVTFGAYLGLSALGMQLDRSIRERALNVGARLAKAALDKNGIGAKTGSGYGYVDVQLEE